MKAIFDLSEFKVESKAVETVQLYVSRDSHTWIKNVASEAGVKMTYVVEELIAYTERDKAVVMTILATLRELTLSIAPFQNNVPKELKDRVNTLLMILERAENE